MPNDRAQDAEKTRASSGLHYWRMFRRALFIGLVGPYFGGAIIFLIMGLVDVSTGSLGKAASGLGTGIAMGFFAYPFALMLGGIPALLTGGVVAWLMEHHRYDRLAWKAAAAGALVTVVCAALLDAMSQRSYGYYLVAMAGLGGSAGLLSTLLLLRINRARVMEAQQSFD